MHSPMPSSHATHATQVVAPIRYGLEIFLVFSRDRADFVTTTSAIFPDCDPCKVSTRCRLAFFRFFAHFHSVLREGGLEACPFIALERVVQRHRQPRKSRQLLPSLHDQRVCTVREEPILQLEFCVQDVSGKMWSPWELLVRMISGVSRSQIRRKFGAQVQPVFGLGFHASA